MGSVFGRKFVRNDKIEGQGKQLLLFAKKIHLQKAEVDRIFEEFCQIENPVTHLAEVSNIIISKKKPYCLFASVLFQIFDRNKLGIVNFLEYMTILWCFLSADEDELARTCFGLFDIYKSRSLDCMEVKYLVNMIWEFNPSKRCLTALNKVDQNIDGVITMEEFVLLNRHHPDLLKPARQLQRHLQSKTVFRRFWKQITRRRVDYFGKQSMYEICGYEDPAYVASSMEYLNLRTDIVPVQYIEQWQFVQRRKATRGTLHQDLPYEIKEILYPHPKNEHAKKTLKTVAKSMGLWTRFGKKKKGIKKNAVMNDPTATGDQHSEIGDGETAPQKGEQESDLGDVDDDHAAEMESFPRPPKPFDDSFLGSLKGVKYDDG